MQSVTTYEERRMRKRILASAIVLLCFPACAQQTTPPDPNAQNAALEQRIRDLEDRVIALEGKLRTMESAQATQQQPSPAPGQAAATPAQAAGAQPSPQAPAPVTTVLAQPSPIEAQTEAIASAGGQLPVY